MDGTTQFSEASLEQKITTRYGILLSQTQLAELLGRTPGGLRYSLSYPSDQHTRDLKASGRNIKSLMGDASFIRVLKPGGKVAAGRYRQQHQVIPKAIQHPPQKWRRS